MMAKSIDFRFCLDVGHGPLCKRYFAYVQQDSKILDRHRSGLHAQIFSALNQPLHAFER